MSDLLKNYRTILIECVEKEEVTQASSLSEAWNKARKEHENENQKVVSVFEYPKLHIVDK